MKNNSLRIAAIASFLLGASAAHAAVPVSEPNALHLFSIGMAGAVLISRLIKRK